MIRFVHTADVHFGMENYGRIDPETGIHTRLLDFARAFDCCIDYAITQKVDFFLFCGDAYKTTNPSPTQQRFFLHALLRLHKAKIPVIIIVGNHDHPLSAGKTNTLDIFSQLPLDGFYVITKPTIISITTNNGPINIVGIPWPTRNALSMHTRYLMHSAGDITRAISQAITEMIHNYAKQLDPNIPAILAAHLTVSSGLFSGSEKRAIYGTDPLFLVSDLAIPPFDYVALGHLHRHQNVNNNGYPAVVYSGSIERIDFGERREKKGFCVVTIYEKNHTTYDFIEIPTRNFIQIEHTLDTLSDHTQQLITAIKSYNITNAIVKIIYYIPEGVVDTVDSKQLQRATQNAMQLISIIPIKKISPRERRYTGSRISNDIAQLLDNYFESRTEWTKRKTQLLQKTNLLLQEQDNELENNEL